MKKRLAAAASIVLAFVTLGYASVLSLALGFLATKHLSGKSAGERGKLGSIRVPFRRYRIHLHHWLYSLALIAIFAVTGFHLVAPPLTYGFLLGVSIQGVYCYEDWHRIVVDR